MQHEVYYDKNKSIGVINFKGDYLETDVPLIKEILAGELKDKPRKQLIIYLAMNNRVENRITRQESLKAMIDIGITHIAFVGGSAANRIIAKIMLKTGRQKLIGDIFKKEEEAINWLNSKI